MLRIITDSTSDLSASQVQALQVDMLPLSVHFGPEVFRDGVDITNAQFFEKLARAEALPTTSQVNPEAFAALFQAYVAAGDEVLGIFLSSDLSGTCQSALIAREMVGGAGIFIVDSRTVTFALGLLVEQAAALRDRGLSGQEVAEQISDLSGRLRLYAVVDTLKYLKMGGRISATTALVGGLLGISPIVSVENGRVEAVGKARGQRAAFTWIAQKLQAAPPDLTLPVAFGHSNAPEAMAACRAFFAAQTAGAQVLTGDIGSVVGTHAGPGATGLAFFVG